MGSTILMEKSCGTITIKDNKVLMVLQNKGHMSFPKGHVEKGESEKETAIRETYEETGVLVKIKDDSPRFKMSYPINNTIKEVIFFFADVVDDKSIKPQDEEIKEVIWKDIKDVRGQLTYENAKLMWDEVLKNIRK